MSITRVGTWQAPLGWLVLVACCDRAAAPTSGGPDVTTARSGPVVGAVSLAAAHDSSCVALSDGTAACWGDDTLGVLGHGVSAFDHPMEVISPHAVPVAGLPDGKAI